MTTCWDCPYRKTIYPNFLIATPYCSKYEKIIPVGHFVYNFFCKDDKYEL